MRSNPNPSAFAGLTAEQQQQLYVWLETLPVVEVIQKVSAPPPEGFGITTYPTSLRRFFTSYRLKSCGDDVTLATDVVAAPVGDATLDQATVATVRQLAFELASSPRVSAKQFKTLSRWVLKLREHEQQDRALALARERLDLDREKFEFNAARAAIIHHAELDQIVQDPKTDNEDKIRRARNALFGKNTKP